MPSRPLIRLVFALLFPFPAFAGDINEELLAAARKSDAATVRALLAKGADVNAKTAYGATALSYAADKGHVEVVKVLLEQGADVNVKDTFYGETPLGWAAYRGHASIVKLLLEKGAEAKDGAFMAGVYQGHVEVVKVILEKGGVRTETLSSALETATKSGRPEIIELLKKAGAVPPPKADFQVDPKILKTYTGTYKKQDGTEFTISLREEKLEGEVEGFSSALEAIDQVTFKPVEFGGMTITFVLEEGKVTTLKLKEGEEDSIFKKVGER